MDEVVASIHDVINDKMRMMEDVKARITKLTKSQRALEDELKKLRETLAFIKAGEVAN